MRRQRRVRRLFRWPRVRRGALLRLFEGRLRQSLRQGHHTSLVSISQLDDSVGSDIAYSAG